MVVIMSDCDGGDSLRICSHMDAYMYIYTYTCIHHIYIHTYTHTHAHTHTYLEVLVNDLHAAFGQYMKSVQLRVYVISQERKMYVLWVLAWCHIALIVRSITRRMRARNFPLLRPIQINIAHTPGMLSHSTKIFLPVPTDHVGLQLLVPDLRGLHRSEGFRR